jgi:Fe2+ or Zn2+ uptake regulation protein
MKPVPRKRPKNDPLRELLRKSGYRATPPRLAVLRMLRQAKRPLSAQNMAEHLPDIDQATVYRTLKSLKEKGIVRGVDLRHNHAHYELAATSEHHHIICLRCGKIEDVPHSGVEGMERAIAQRSRETKRPAPSMGMWSLRSTFPLFCLRAPEVSGSPRGTLRLIIVRSSSITSASLRDYMSSIHSATLFTC